MIPSTAAEQTTLPLSNLKQWIFIIAQKSEASEGTLWSWLGLLISLWSAAGDGGCILPYTGSRAAGYGLV